MRYLLALSLCFLALKARAEPPTFTYPADWDHEVPAQRSRLRARHFAVVESRESREVLLLFALAVRGWNSAAAVPALERFLGQTRTPFGFVRSLAEEGQLLTRIRWARLSRNYGQLAQSYEELGAGELDLGSATLPDLLQVNGISYKTAEYFLMYSRQNYEGFAPDVHILNYLRRRFPRSRVPKSSPGKTQCGEFLRLRALYASEAQRRGLSFRELDTAIWEAGSSGN